MGALDTTKFALGAIDSTKFASALSAFGVGSHVASLDASLVSRATLDAATRLQPLAARAAQAYADAPAVVLPEGSDARGEPDEVVTLLRALLGAVGEQTDALKGRVKYRPDPMAVLGLLLSLLSFFGYERVLRALEQVLRDLMP